jgi:hypothetical protein
MPDNLPAVSTLAAAEEAARSNPRTVVERFTGEPEPEAPNEVDGNPRQARRAPPIIRVRTILEFDRLPPAQKLIAMIVAMAGTDLATSLRFDCYPDVRIDVWYFIAGVPYQLIPPPCSMWPYMIREFRRHTTFAPRDRPPWWRLRNLAAFPQTPSGGHLALQFENIVTRPAIHFFRGQTGEHVESETTDPHLRAGSRSFFGEWTRQRGTELLFKFPDPG